jgi:hypothetical protein
MTESHIERRAEAVLAACGLAVPPWTRWPWGAWDIQHNLLTLRGGLF